VGGGLDDRLPGGQAVDADIGKAAHQEAKDNGKDNTNNSNNHIREV